MVSWKLNRGMLVIRTRIVKVNFGMLSWYPYFEFASTYSTWKFNIDFVFNFPTEVIKFISVHALKKNNKYFEAFLLVTKYFF